MSFSVKVESYFYFSFLLIHRQLLPENNFGLVFLDQKLSLGKMSAKVASYLSQQQASSDEAIVSVYSKLEELYNKK